MQTDAQKHDAPFKENLDETEEIIWTRARSMSEIVVRGKDLFWTLIHLFFKREEWNTAVTLTAVFSCALKTVQSKSAASSPERAKTHRRCLTAAWSEALKRDRTETPVWGVRTEVWISEERNQGRTSGRGVREQRWKAGSEPWRMLGLLKFRWEEKKDASPPGVNECFWATYSILYQALINTIVLSDDVI